MRNRSKSYSVGDDGANKEMSWKMRYINNAPNE